MSHRRTAARARFPWRVFLYLAVVLYLVADLYVWEGPLKQALEQQFSPRERLRRKAAAKGWVATVNTHPISRERLDKAVALFLYRRGKTAAELSPANLSITRRAALQQLIDEEVIRQFCEAEKFHASPEVVDAVRTAFESQFTTPEELEARSGAQGLTEADRNTVLTEYANQLGWMELRLEKAIAVTEEETRAWYERHQDELVAPEVARARHIFLSTVEEDSPEREALMGEIFRQLSAGEKTFEALAAEYSEDERTKLTGGDLNYFSRERMPEDFAEKVFLMLPSEVSEPFRTSMGWHIVQMMEREAERTLSFEEVKETARVEVENAKRAYAVKLLIHKLRRGSDILVFVDQLN